MPNDISSDAATASGSRAKAKTLQSEPPSAAATASQQATSHPTKNLPCIDNDVKFIQRHAEQGTTHLAKEVQCLDSDPEFAASHGAQEAASPTKKKIRCIDNDPKFVQRHGKQP
ncbi:hypothetical protein H634G_05464 [Metarhizium anisopliae BRIP 53293]|uniref:Uncharacterized protein n=1 Tax=Metarhizium anisopliae BRIP 53293 TaxID=1291518 RepID=A0A0D9NYY2_METAN|nr:hypothetical protein H634G_05464 [Metarhizium anisopliae BRIP 53293]KJK91474.1 hypothetical protein H633G_04689 [Metarhizium anisopliae BRIP 53284]